MKRIIGSAVALSALAVGCAKVIPEKVTTENFSTGKASQLISEGKNSEAADEYARIGELLLIPEGVGYADQMFDRALQADPKNRKANFYSAITKPLLVAKGFVTRFEPIADDMQSQALVQIREHIAMQNLPELSKLALELPEGKKPFESYYDVQRAVRTELLPAIEQSSEKLARIDASQPLELNINLSRIGINTYSGFQSIFQSLGQSVGWNTPTEYSYCQKSEYQYDKQGRYMGWTCTHTVTVREYHFNRFAMPSTYKIDEADLKMLKGSALAGLDVLRLGTAYSAKGLTAAIKRIRATQKRTGYYSNNAFMISQILKDYKDLGLLESDHQLGEVSRSANEAMQHVLDLAAMQDKLCAKKEILPGYSFVLSERAVNQNLFQNLCMVEDDVKRIQAIADLIAGPKRVPIGVDANDNLVKVLVDVSGALANPPHDLKAIFPVVDWSGKILSTPDPTFGGIFPEADLIEKSKQVVGRSEWTKQ